MSASIKDIARLAGVSHSTVSRALRNSPLIPPGTAARIQKIAQETGYTASAIARSLVTNKTEAIGVVVTSIADPFNGEVVAGIEEFANRHGYTVILATSQASAEREIAAVRSFQARRVDGVLVASSRVGALHQPLLSELHIPIVLLNNQHPSAFMHSVLFDNANGAYQATRHLVELGHKRIAYLGDRFGLHSDEERYQGYRRMMTEAGLRVSNSLLAHGDGKPEGAQQAARKLLSSTARPTAIVSYNDMSALGVLREAAARGIAVPGELSVTGFDDIFFAAYLRPPLTTVRQPMKELGRRAMELLLALLRGESAAKIVTVEGDLIVRGSTAEVPVPLTSRSFPGKTPPPNPRSKV